MNKTPARAASETSILDTDWPPPLVSAKDISEHAPWLLEDMTKTLAFAPPRLIDIAALVTSQENACRYCYGAQRASMRLFGYSDAQIRDLERDVQLADDMTREVVNLARRLARSNPRPVKAELAALARLGIGPKAAAEIVYVVASTCYANRIGTFLALEPVRRLERLAETSLGRLIGSLMVTVMGMRSRRVSPAGPVAAQGFLAPLIRQLPDAPITVWFAGLVRSCFDSVALERRSKLLILAVVGRTMGCRFCEDAAKADLQALGLDGGSIQRTLDTLAAPELSPRDRLLLDWARETVHYEPGVIQKRTRALAGQVGVDVLLEAIGTAAVSNTAVRLAMLLE
jgi:alkylhydroperoxidase family enzyme